MERKIKNKAASVRARLMNIARSEKIDFDSLLLRYFQERFLYRLAISKFSNRLILKGGLLLICLEMPVSRPTKDIDFLAEKLKNDLIELKHVFEAVAIIPSDDGVNFISSSITSERIKEDADYEGIRLKIDAVLGQARKKIQMDIGFGDIITPKAIQVNFPSLLEDKPAKIKAYSIESVVSEKFEAMIKLAMVNSRMKDFYDICSLSISHNFDGAKLKKAIENTFKRRKTPIPDDPVIFRQEFQKDKDREIQWSAFLRKSRIQDANQTFSVVMDRITAFLRPMVLSIKENTRTNKTWTAKSGIWK